MLTAPLSLHERDIMILLPGATCLGLLATTVGSSDLVGRRAGAAAA